MCRSYRFGQQKPTFVYRLVAVGSLEHRVLKLQVSKELLSRRVVDDLDSHFERTCVTYATSHDPDELLAPSLLFFSANRFTWLPEAMCGVHSSGLALVCVTRARW